MLVCLFKAIFFFSLFIATIYCIVSFKSCKHILGKDAAFNSTNVYFKLGFIATVFRVIPFFIADQIIYGLQSSQIYLQSVSQLVK